MVFLFISGDLLHCPEIRLVPIDNVLLQAINDYDVQVHLIDRKSWIADFIQKYRGVAAMDQNDQICGYGILKETNHIYSLSPVLADTPSIAKLIVKHLLDMMPDDKLLEIPFYKDNPDALELAQTLGFPDGAIPHYQMFTKERFVIPIQKAYCIMTMSKFA